MCAEVVGAAYKERIGLSTCTRVNVYIFKREASSKFCPSICGLGGLQEGVACKREYDTLIKKIHVMYSSSVIYASLIIVVKLKSYILSHSRHLGFSMTPPPPPSQLDRVGQTVTL